MAGGGPKPWVAGVLERVECPWARQMPVVPGRPMGREAVLMETGPHGPYSNSSGNTGNLGVGCVGGEGGASCLPRGIGPAERPKAGQSQAGLRRCLGLLDDTGASAPPIAASLCP